MRKFTKLMLTLALLVLAGGAKADTERVNLTFGTDWYCTASWNAETRIFSWGSGGTGNPDWIFINVTNLSGDVSKYTKLYFKLENFTNSADNKLTLYFKENKGNTQSMDYVAKVEITPDANGEFEFDLTTFDWKNNANPSETIDKTKIYDVTLYGGARSGDGDGSVKITEAYVERPKVTWNASKNHMLLATNGEAKSNPWDYQVNYTLPTPLVKDKTYVIEYAINAVNGGETRVVPNGDGAQYLDTKGLWTNEFTRYKVEFTANGNHTKLEIDLGACGGEVYFDNVSLVEKGQTTNLIANGDFETEGTAGWSAVSNTIAQVEKELGEIQEPGILVSVGEAGWRTFRTGSNVQVSDPNVKAYAAKYMAEGNYVQLTPVTEFGAWQSVLIEAPQGNYLLKSPASVTGIDDAINDLKANGPTPLPGDGTLYGLAKINGVVGFYKIASTSEVPAWAIYLQIPAGGREFIGFGDETTGISTVKAVEEDHVVYTLGGQRVVNAKKGIFIVNGKKVIK
ncbi:MAG: hypothetical protein J5797_11070 [Prevotella sp.]|nr:hypothetical protein [Prevotella sp.]